MVDKQDGKTLADPDLDEWLRVDSLELKPLFDLARRVDPDLGDWPPLYPWKPRWRALKNAITTGNLKATYATPIPEKHTIVFLADLWAFAEWRGDEWEWARDFCKRWAKVRGEVLPQSQPPKKPANTINKSNRGPRRRIDYEALEDALQAVAKKLNGDIWIERQTSTELAERAVAKMKADGIGKRKTPAIDTARKHFDKMRKDGQLP